MTVSAGMAQAPDARLAQENAEKAFRDQDLELALEYYREARAAGADGPKLQYNLGVVHYRLGQYVLAQTQFLLASRNPAARQIAHYNLARCAQKLAQTEDAAIWYRRAMLGEDARITELARRARAQLLAAQVSPYQLDLSLRAGSDTAVVGLIDQVTSLPTDTPDSFIESGFALRGDARQWGGGQWSWLLQAYALLFDTVQEVNVQSAAGGLRWQQERWGGRMSAELQWAREWLDSRAYQRRVNLALDYTRALGEGLLRGGVSLQSLSPDSAAPDGIRGWRYQLEARYLRRLSGGLGLAVLGGELNDRDDDRNSPTRLSLSLAWRSPAWLQWRIRPQADLRISRYPGDSRPAEQRYRYSLALESPIDNGWTLMPQVMVERNRSDNLSQSYEHVVAVLGFHYRR